MYKEHRIFSTSKTEGMSVWRYLEFWQFLNLLETSKLYFPSLSDLGDQNEGRIPEEIFEMMKENDKKEGGRNWAELHKVFVEGKLRHSTLVSSWAAGNEESFALWKMYAREKLGIAIRTDIEGLKASFHPTNRNIYIGEVKYYDPGNPEYYTGNTYYSSIVKHIYYSFENEVRCVTDLQEESEPHLVKVDLNKLIQEVYISPFAFEKGFQSIVEFLRTKHGLSFKIKVSRINDSWLG